MSPEPKTDPTHSTTLRLWPGVAIVAVQWILRYGIPLVVPGSLFVGGFGGLAGGLLIVVWWLSLSRAPWKERVGAVVLIAVALAVSPLILHESLATAGMGILFYMHAIPVLSLGFVAWAVLARDVTGARRWATMAAAIFASCAVWGLVRTEGMTGDGESQFAWRWSATAEDRLLARTGAPDAVGMTLPDTDAVTWPGFRGPSRDGIVAGVRIATDWQVSPPREIWRRAIGPGWSSFAVGETLFFTQEQRGESEVVSSYRLDTGEPVWRHTDEARFWESNGGAGPRATPTLDDGRVYAFGATGIVNALDARDGSVAWTRDAAADTGAELPEWGFSSSPLVVGDRVVIAAGDALVAYDSETGDLLWKGPAPADGETYSSPHLSTIEDVEQILLMRADGAVSVRPADGEVLWKHPWPSSPIVQPALTADGDILISSTGVSGGIGTRRIVVSHGAAGWSTEEGWMSNRLKPNFNDFVIHEGHAYGFDGSILACIDLGKGERQWKGGRYGYGQLVLLPEQDLLLVLSEQGELALVSASPEAFSEVARVPAIEGKTWNHPALVDDVLLVRNGEEMAAFRLAQAGD